MLPEIKATRPSASVAAYSEEYFQLRVQDPAWQIEARNCRRLAGVTRTGTVLELGCGSGHLLSMMGPRTGIGIDYDPAVIRRASQAFPCFDFRVGDASAPEVPEGSIDCIVSMHLFEHLSDPERAIRSWARALTPGGKIIIATPNSGFSHPEIYYDPDHKHIYSGEELCGMLRRGGLAIEHAFTVGVWGVRRTRFLWRFQRRLARLRMPPLGSLRWRGQTLMVSARGSGEVSDK